MDNTKIEEFSSIGACLFLIVLTWMGFALQLSIRHTEQVLREFLFVSLVMLIFACIYVVYRKN